ncbi:hypothetical protein VTK56DRAFT_1958 [Thermocarpiscus australiensis]
MRGLYAQGDSRMVASSAQRLDLLWLLIFWTSESSKANDIERMFCSSRIHNDILQCLHVRMHNVATRSAQELPSAPRQSSSALHVRGAYRFLACNCSRDPRSSFNKYLTMYCTIHTHYAMYLLRAPYLRPARSRLCGHERTNLDGIFSQIDQRCSPWRL